MNITVTYPEENITRVTFFSEEGETRAVVTETLVCKDLFDIIVVEASETGRALFQETGDSLNFTASDNLSLVLRWVRQCREHLLLPL